MMRGLLQLRLQIQGLPHREPANNRVDPSLANCSDSPDPARSSPNEPKLTSRPGLTLTNPNAILQAVIRRARRILHHCKGQIGPRNRMKFSTRFQFWTEFRLRTARANIFVDFKRSDRWIFDQNEILESPRPQLSNAILQAPI